MAYTPSSVFSYTSIDQTGTKYKENIGAITLDLYDSSTQITNAQKVDTLARAINSLTTNTYENSEVVATFDINEVLLSEGE